MPEPRATAQTFLEMLVEKGEERMAIEQVVVPLIIQTCPRCLCARRHVMLDDVVVCETCGAVSPLPRSGA